MTAALAATPAPAPILSLVDPARPDGDLTVDELGSRIVGMAGRLAAATCQWLLLVAEFDRREGCRRFGLWSTARWLSHHCGVAHRTALEHVRVGRALALFPALAEEMSAGRLSYSQVRAISRVPREGEHRLVADLIEVARNGTAAQLEVMLQGVRTADEADEYGAPPEQYVRTGWTTTSQWHLSARLDPEGGTLVDKAITELARAAGVTKAQALARMAELALATLHDGGAARRRLRGDELAAIVVHVEAAGYPAEDVPRPADGGVNVPPSPERPDDAPRSGERAVGRIADGPGLPRRVVERLACAGRVRLLLEAGDGTPLDLGRSHRTVTTRMYMALLARDRGCAHPGCRSRDGLEAHHVRHWLHGGATTMANMLLLCRGHHHAHHDGDLRIESLGGQRWRFLRWDGRELLPVVHPDDYADSARTDTDDDVAPDAPTSRWRGERLDRRWAISVLAQRRANDRNRKKRGAAWASGRQPHHLR